MTEYVILKGEAENRWHEVESAEASSASRALAAAKVGAGKYVAIPARSWKELTVKVEQTTKVTIG